MVYVDVYAETILDPSADRKSTTAEKRKARKPSEFSFSECPSEEEASDDDIRVMLWEMSLPENFGLSQEEWFEENFALMS